MIFFFIGHDAFRCVKNIIPIFKVKSIKLLEIVFASAQT